MKVSDVPQRVRVTSVRRTVEFRRLQAAFQARGEAASQDYQRTGVGCSTQEALAMLQARSATRRAELPPEPKP